MIKKIIFFTEVHFLKWDYQRFGIEILERNGFQVEVYDFTPLLNKNFYKKIKIPDPIVWSGHHVFHTKKKALETLSKLKDDCFVIFLMVPRIDLFFLFKVISKNKIFYGFFACNSTPMINCKKIFARKLYERFRDINFLKIKNKFLSFFPWRLFCIMPANLVFAGGRESTWLRFPVDEKSKIIWAHASNYDRYMEERLDISVESHKNFFVFLDEFYPFHPDYFFHGITPKISPNEYYSLLCIFFDYIEKMYNISVIIAVHPRSDYENKPDYFHGREIVKNKTASLVKNAVAVICHASSSIDYAVLFEKPLIFVTTDKLNKSYIANYIEILTECLGKRAVNIEKEINLSKNEFEINREKYSEYKNKYIKKDGTEDLPIWQIVANSIKKI